MSPQPEPRFIFFDCDDTLYQNDWKTADKITESISAFCEGELGVDGDTAYELYKKHGTCLKGLLVEQRMRPDVVETYLEKVHDIDYSDIAPDPALRALVQHCKTLESRFVFTASTKEHAERCMAALGGVGDLFSLIVDTRTCSLETKHSRASFEAAREAAGCTDARECVLIDDSVKNIQTAKALGWTTVLIGLTKRDTGEAFTCPEADHHISSIHYLPDAMPHLFPTLKPPYPKP